MDKYKPFYQKHIDRTEQKTYIQSILDEYKDKPLSDELFKELYDRLSWEKHLGNIQVPFKLERKEGHGGTSYFEVTMETKV
ncbi:MAG: hypothetical protein GWP59_06360 [Chlamydiales bacterium]|nr:hypothetical protein [Chlamydiales bacterium]NCF71306.1 hypothetical protein [Chlamydiales bacterium]